MTPKLIEDIFGKDWNKDPDLWFGPEADALVKLRKVYNAGVESRQPDLDYLRNEVSILRALVEADRHYHVHLEPTKHTGLWTWLKHLLS